MKKLENFVGISGSALAWFKKYLSDHHQFIAVNEEVSYQSQMQYGVPQGSVLGPLHFMIYMLPLGNIIRKHGVNFQVKSSHLYSYGAFNNTDCVKARNSVKLEDIVSVMHNNKIKHSIFSERHFII